MRRLSEQLSGEISTHLVPQLGLGDERFLHTILLSFYLYLVLKKVLVIPARAQNYLEGGSIHLIQRASGRSNTWVLLAGA